jgi:hypothetical protein
MASKSKKKPAKKSRPRAAPKVVIVHHAGRRRSTPKRKRPARTFRFALRADVMRRDSNEIGTVRARAEYITSEPSYLVLYRAANGRQMREWWEQSDLVPFTRPAA